MKRLFILSCLSLLLLSCQGTRKEAGAQVTLQAGTELLLPIYGGDAQSRSNLEAGVLTHMSNKGFNTISARRLSKLSAYTDQSSICPGGNFNAKEIGNCGRIAGADSLTAIYIDKVQAYAPQSISLRISRVHLNGQRFSKKETFLRIDLSYPREKKRFQQFIDASSQNESSRSHTAALSPRNFLDYVGNRIAEEISFMEKKL